MIDRRYRGVLGLQLLAVIIIDGLIDADLQVRNHGGEWAEEFDSIT